jgi:hypothetical protein
MGLQDTEFTRGLPWRRAMLFGAAFFLMLPTARWMASPSRYGGRLAAAVRADGGARPGHRPLSRLTSAW